MSDFEDDIEYADMTCSKCGSGEVMRRDCTALGCDEGYIDEYETDPINCAPGECFSHCDECNGHGCHVWCRDCGWDVLNGAFINKKYEDEFNARNSTHEHA